MASSINITKQRMLTFLETGSNQVDGSLITDGNGGGGAIPIIPELVRYLTCRYLCNRYDKVSKIRTLFTQKAMQQSWQYECRVNINKYRDNPKYPNLGDTYSVSLSTLKAYQSVVNEYYENHDVPGVVIEEYNKLAITVGAPILDTTIVNQHKDTPVVAVTGAATLEGVGSEVIAEIERIVLMQVQSQIKQVMNVNRELSATNRQLNCRVIQLMTLIQSSGTQYQLPSGEYRYQKGIGELAAPITRNEYESILMICNT